MMSLMNSYGLVPTELAMYITQCSNGDGTLKEYNKPVSGIAILYMVENGFFQKLKYELQTYLLSKVTEFDSDFLKDLFNYRKIYYQYLKILLKEHRKTLEQLFNDYRSTATILKLITTDTVEDHYRLFAIAAVEFKLNFPQLILDYCGWLGLGGVSYTSVYLSNLFRVFIKGYHYISHMYEDTVAEVLYAEKFYQFLALCSDDTDNYTKGIPEAFLFDWLTNVCENEGLLRRYISFLNDFISEEALIDILSKVANRIPVSLIPSHLISKIPAVYFI